MSESYDKVIKKVPVLLAEYPTKEKLFEWSDKFVLFWGWPSNLKYNLYDYFAEKAHSDMPVHRILAPANLSGERLTFVFWNFTDTPRTIAEELADAIILRKWILPKPVKVLCNSFDDLSCPDNFKKLCKNCQGLMECSQDLPRPCFKYYDKLSGWSRKPPTTLVIKFQEFLQQFKFERINQKMAYWPVWPSTMKKITEFLNDFNKDVAVFARKFCDYVSPDHSYAHADIALLNQTYVRFQATHLLCFQSKVKKERLLIRVLNHENGDLYVPVNLEAIMQHMNISMAGINNDWLAISEKNRTIDELKHIYDPQALQNLINGHYMDMLKVWKTDYLFYMDESTQLVKDIYDRFYTSKVYYKSDIFKQVVANKSDDIAAALIRAMVTTYANSCSLELDKLNSWVDNNLQDLQQDTNVSKFFRNLHKKIDKYFSYNNAYIINSWFFDHNRRVPDNWQDHLAGFGRPDEYWLMPEYEMHELEKTILQRDITFSEFVNIVDFCLRESFEFLVDYLESYIRRLEPKKRTALIKYSDFLADFDYQKNFFILFSFWEDIADLQSRVPLSIVKLLLAKFEQSFRKVKIDIYLQQTFKNSVKRAVLFKKKNYFFLSNPNNTENYIVLDNYNYNHSKVHAIYKQLQGHGRRLFEDFKTNSIYRIVQHMIRAESPKLNAVLDRLSEILINDLQLHNEELGSWKTSQPYQKTIALKYALTSYEDFISETKTIFDTINVDIPEEAWDHFKLVQAKLDHLQEQAELSSFEAPINTRWNWGRGYISDELNIKNGGAALRSHTDLLDNGFFIFLVWGLIVLYRILKSYQY